MQIKAISYIRMHENSEWKKVIPARNIEFRNFDFEETISENLQILYLSNYVKQSFSTLFTSCTYFTICQNMHDFLPQKMYFK